ncbi:hypothetical protein [Spirosoma sp. 48-14]|uniref:hypothetical protein n=1 Tax=Spirosoma sp. 48-14 TaxID=1895854 RepID=UPI00096309B3|nr:hypothetical protein [Spirosoma sp. 48-14]OJW76288.1 MAG: hypothetical protein BGO59_22480 [Spirosoma sp. 48-14]
MKALKIILVLLLAYIVFATLYNNFQDKNKADEERKIAEEESKQRAAAISRGETYSPAKKAVKVAHVFNPLNWLIGAPYDKGPSINVSE